MRTEQDLPRSAQETRRSRPPSKGELVGGEDEGERRAQAAPLELIIAVAVAVKVEDKVDARAREPDQLTSLAKVHQSPPHCGGLG